MYFVVIDDALKNTLYASEAIYFFAVSRDMASCETEDMSSPEDKSSVATEG